MRTIYVIIFTTTSERSSRKILGTYYFKTKKMAKDYAKKFKEACIVHVEYKIEPLLEYNK